MKFDDFEANSLEYYYKRSSHKPKESNHMLVVVDIRNVLDMAFALVVDCHACPFYPGPLVCHRFQECPSLANLKWECMAYVADKTYPNWNAESQDTPSTPLPPMQQVCAKGLPSKAVANKNNRPRARSPS